MPAMLVTTVQNMDSHGLHVAVIARIVHCRAEDAEEDLIDVLLLAAVDDFREIEALAEKADTTDRRRRRGRSGSRLRDWISLWRALLKAKIGDTVSLHTPIGIQQIDILDVRYPH